MASLGDDLWKKDAVIVVFFSNQLYKNKVFIYSLAHLKTKKFKIPLILVIVTLWCKTLMFYLSIVILNYSKL